VLVDDVEARTVLWRRCCQFHRRGPKWCDEGECKQVSADEGAGERVSVLEVLKSIPGPGRLLRQF